MSRRGDLERTFQRIWAGEHPVVSFLLWPLSLVWWLGSVIHRALYAVGLKPSVQLGVPVISVGNVVVGGAGKTPVTLELATRLIRAGRRVAVVSRGYGRVSTGTVIVSDGQALRATAADGGDEPVWLARREPKLMVVVSEKRAEAASAALDLGADLILMDDGLSHYGLRRDVDVVVIDDRGRFGNGRMLPAGPLRMPKGRARQAALLWWTKVNTLEHRRPEPLLLRTQPAVHSSYAAETLVDLELHAKEAVETLRGRRVLAVCGIARPENFESSLEALGANVRALLPFPDHHRFAREDVAAIERAVREHRCDLVVTTEKDAVRLALVTSGDLYRALAMKLSVLDPEALDGLIRRFQPAAPLETG